MQSFRRNDDGGLQSVSHTGAKQRTRTQGQYRTTVNEANADADEMRKNGLLEYSLIRRLRIRIEHAQNCTEIRFRFAVGLHIRRIIAKNNLTTILFLELHFFNWIL